MPADKRIPVTEELFDELTDDKPEGMTWDLYLRRLYEGGSDV